MANVFTFVKKTNNIPFFISVCLNVVICMLGIETTSLVLTENFNTDSLCGCSLAVLTRADIDTSFQTTDRIYCIGQFCRLDIL